MTDSTIKEGLKNLVLNTYWDKIEEYTAAPCVLTNRILRTAAAEFSDQTTNRPYLRCLYFDNASNMLVATDGHAMLCLFTEKKQQPKEQGLKLSNLWIKKMLKMNDKPVIFSDSGEHGTINGLELFAEDYKEPDTKPPFRDKVVIPAAVIEGNYPDYKRVIPTNFNSGDLPEGQQIWLAGHYIEGVEKMRKILNAASVKFHYHGNMSATRFDFLTEKNELIGFAVLMPIRSS